LQTLLPLAEQVLTSSQASDAELLRLKAQKIADDEQRRIEQQQRQKESDDSARALTEQSAKAARLQTLHNGLLTRLGDFSGSEDQKQAAALDALSAIQAGARRLERERDFWRSTAIFSAAVAVVLGIKSAMK
jgi:hypothetical protein